MDKNMNNNITGLVSIIMPAYNSSKHIGQAIESVLSQTYTKWELLITDDCSTDNTREVVEQYSAVDPRIKYFCMQKNGGAGIARNNSVEQAQGRYIAFLDSDDRWLPKKLEKELEMMNDKQCAATYSSYFICGNDGTVNGIVLARTKETDFSIKCDDKMGNLTFMYDTAIIGKHYLPTIRRRQDWAHKMFLMNICKVAYGVKEPLAIYRHTDGSISRNKIKLAKYNIAGFRTLGWSQPKSVLFFIFFFMPSYICKTIKNKIYNSSYKNYLHFLN